MLFIDLMFFILKVGNVRLLVGDSLVGSIVLLMVLIYLMIFSCVVMLSLYLDDKVLDKLN